MEREMTKGMLITMVSLAPQELLIDQLEKGLKEYKEAMLLNTSERDKIKILEGALSLPCLMILTKSTGLDPIEMIKDMSNLERVRNLIKPNLS